MLKVADELNGAIAIAGDAQADGDLAFLGDLRLDAGDLHTGGKHTLEIHHDGGPGEAFAGEDAVEKVGAIEDVAVLRLTHAGFVGGALLLEGEGLGVNGVDAGLSGGGALTDGVQPDPETEREHANDGQ